MLFALICKDKPDHLQTRLDNRPEHLVYLRKLNDAGTLKIAGPFLNDEGKPYGTLLVVEATDKNKAAEIGAGDPYAKAGLFESVRIRAWNWTFNNPANPSNP